MKKPKPPKGYRLLRSGETRLATDIRYSFNFGEPEMSERWDAPDDWDMRNLVGVEYDPSGTGSLVWARKITRMKTKKSKPKKKGYRFAITVGHAGSYKDAERALLSAFAKRMPDGCEFYLTRHRNPTK